MNLYESIKKAGVVGSGGGGFPTHLKYRSKVEYVIANGAECEPLLCVDKFLMKEFSDELLDGLEKAVDFSGAKKGILALKKKHKDLIALFNEKIKLRKKIELYLLDDFYPAGDEFVLVYEVLGKLISEGGIPLEAGVVVNNVLTLININRASSGIPVISRPLTVTGEVKSPSNFILPIGTSIKEAISLAGGVTVDSFRVITGGPMMGEIIDDLNFPISKTTSAVIVLPETHYLVYRKLSSLDVDLRRGKSACDQCRYCSDLCPRFLLGHELEPHLIMRSLPYSFNETFTASFLCCGCQLCSVYACPLFLSPGKILQSMRKTLIKNKAANPHKNAGFHARFFRNFRKVPLNRLIKRLDLDRYPKDVPFKEINYKPACVKIPLCQHAGIPAIPVVKPGQEVKEGQVIAEVPEGSVGAYAHSSISGIIKEVIRDQYIIIASSA